MSITPNPTTASSPNFFLRKIHKKFFNQNSLSQIALISAEKIFHLATDDTDYTKEIAINLR